MTTRPAEDPPPFEAIARRHSVLPAASESEENHHLEQVGEDISRRASAPLVYINYHEDLPSYNETHEPEQPLPSYEESHRLTPIVSYNLYQISRKLQVLTPATRASFGRPRYRLTSRTMFSKKADMTLTRLPTGAVSAAENCPGKEVGFVQFDRSSTTPWMPRAKAEMVKDDADGKDVFPMSASNFCDWKFDVEGQSYCWKLTHSPMALSLFEHRSNSLLARFVYSAKGTMATRGAEVGIMEIFGGSRSGGASMVELVLASCQVPLLHWKNMGRQYNNADYVPRARSMGIGLVTSYGSEDMGVFGL